MRWWADSGAKGMRTGAECAAAAARSSQSGQGNTGQGREDEEVTRTCALPVLLALLSGAQLLRVTNHGEKREPQ